MQMVCFLVSNLLGETVPQLTALSVRFGIGSIITLNKSITQWSKRIWVIVMMQSTIKCLRKLCGPWECTLIQWSFFYLAYNRCLSISGLDLTLPLMPSAEDDHPFNYVGCTAAPPANAISTLMINANKRLGNDLVFQSSWSEILPLLRLRRSWICMFWIS